MVRPNDDMQRLRFYPDEGAPALLHIELPGGIVNIRVGLTDAQGRAVNAIQISPDDETRGGDGQGRVWHLAEDGYRLIRDASPDDDEPDNEPSDDEEQAERRPNGHWSLITTVTPDADEFDDIAEQIRDGATHGDINRDPRPDYDIDGHNYCM